MTLENDGERMLRSNFQGTLRDHLQYVFHIATYEFALEHIHGHEVLEFGCGSGYGTAMLAERAKTIVGVDVSAEAVRHAREEFQRDNLEYQKIDDVSTASLPFGDASFDAVVTFQVIEHVTRDRQCMRELHRVLRPGGTIIVATPDRQHRLLPLQKPWNAFHVREYSAAGLRRLMQPLFEDIRILKMGGVPEALDVELAHVRKMRWLSIPFTGPLVPERVRVPVLKWLMKVRRARHDSNAESRGRTWDIGVESVRIAEPREVHNSVNLIALARRRDR